MGIKNIRPYSTICDERLLKETWLLQYMNLTLGTRPPLTIFLKNYYQNCHGLFCLPTLPLQEMGSLKMIIVITYSVFSHVKETKGCNTNKCVIDLTYMSSSKLHVVYEHTSEVTDLIVFTHGGKLKATEPIMCHRPYLP